MNEKKVNFSKATSSRLAKSFSYSASGFPFSTLNFILATRVLANATATANTTAAAEVKFPDPNPTSNLGASSPTE